MKVEKDVSKLFLTQIGENIKKKRKKKDLSLEELGLEIGLTRMQVHRIEKGYNITATTILKLSMALEITPGELVKFDYKSKKEDLEKLVNNNKASKVKLKK
jgi:transcriptional regulator with XRE-family HTH domain